MRILSLSSLAVNQKLKGELSNIDTPKIDSILSTIYYKNILILNEKDRISILEEINKDYDYIIIDLLTMLREHVRYKEEIKLRSSLDENIKKHLREIETNKEGLFLEVVNIIINSLIEKYHVSKIILLNISIDDSGQHADNNLLHNLYASITRENPGLNLSKEIKASYSIEKKEYFIEESILNKIEFNKYIFPNEKIHKSIRNIRYYFESAKVFNKDKLIIVFSSFSKDDPKYNYVKTLKAIDCNKLYILDDYGEKGCYYLGLDGNFDVETSVMSLISKIMSEKNITFNSVISVGSSKGGSAAIYYGFKYNFKEIIAGAPQYKIGSYLMDLSIKTYGKDIFGTLTEANRVKYDNLIRKVITSRSSTKISILTSEGDNQYRRLLKDIELVLKSNKVDFKIDKCDINHHNEISKEFVDYSYSKIVHSLNNKGCINNKLLKINKIARLLKNNRWRNQNG